MAPRSVESDRPRPVAPGLPAPDTFSRNLPQFFSKRSKRNGAMSAPLSIVKPDGVSRNLIGQVYSRLEKANLSIIAAPYAAPVAAVRPKASMPCTAKRPFFKDLVKYMTSGRVVVQVLEGDNAIAALPRDHGRHRSEEGRSRHDSRDLALSIEQNVVHGSDSAENAATEITYFFRTTELHSRGLMPRPRRHDVTRQKPH